MTAPNGTRIGGWLLNTADSHANALADGDGRAELLITSPWGMGILELAPSGGLAVAMMARNGAIRRLAAQHSGQSFRDRDGGRAPARQDPDHAQHLHRADVHVDAWVYEAIGIRVQRVSTEALTLPALNDPDVGECAGAVTTKQAQLFNNRANAPTTDIVVYLIRSTVPPYKRLRLVPGRPAGRGRYPGASQWTMAHEIGHVLRLRTATRPRPAC